MRRLALTIIASCVALTACASADRTPSPDRAPSPERTGTAAAASTPTSSPRRELVPYDFYLGHSRKHPYLDTMACQLITSPRDPGCGEMIAAASEIATATQRDVERFLGHGRYPKLAEWAHTLRRTVNLVRDMNCFGMTGKAPGGHEAALCEDFGRLAAVTWLSFQTEITGPR